MTIEIPLTKGLTALVDEVDSDLNKMKWCAQTSPFEHSYAVRHSHVRPKERVRIVMHRVVMERILGRSLLKGEDVDHANRNGLDNRRCNLRVATRSQNIANRGPLKTNTSGFKGVNFIKSTGKWQAAICVKGVQISLGTFLSPVDAARAYNDAALTHFGEFAYLNPIESEGEAT